MAKTLFLVAVLLLPAQPWAMGGAVPSGYPSTFMMGYVFEAHVDAAGRYVPAGSEFNTVDHYMAPIGAGWSATYRYIIGGTRVDNGPNCWWNAWPGGGAMPTNWMNLVNGRGYMPVFIYENMQAFGGNCASCIKSAFDSAAFMGKYFSDWADLMIKVDAWLTANPTKLVTIDVEPDVWGYMQQNYNNNPASISAMVAGATNPGGAYPWSSLAAFPNTVQGAARAMLYIKDQRVAAGNRARLKLALHVSSWATAPNPATAQGAVNVATHASTVAGFVNACKATSGSDWDLLFLDPADGDAGLYSTNGLDPAGTTHWWDKNNVTQPTFNRYRDWVNALSTNTSLRAMLWQMPIGNQVYRTESNTHGHYQDNKIEYFLNPTDGSAHICDWAANGVIGILWGRGAIIQAGAGYTCGTGGPDYWYITWGTDYSGGTQDNITNAGATGINATIADDDGGYLRSRMPAYFAAPCTIPGVGTPTFTPTRTATPSATRTATPTSSRTSTPASSATSTVTPTRTASPTYSSTSTPASSATSTTTPTRTASPTFSRTSTPASSATSTTTPTATSTRTASPTYSRTGTPSSTFTPASSATSTSSPTPTRTASPTFSRTSTPSSTFTPASSATSTSTPTASSTRTVTPTFSPSSSATSSRTATQTITPGPSATSTSTLTPSPSRTSTPSSTQTSSPAPSSTSTSTGTPSRTATGTTTPSSSPTISPTSSASGTPTNGPSPTSTAALSSTSTLSPSATRTATASGTPSATPSSTPTPSSSPSISPTSSASGTPTNGPSPTSTAVLSSTSTLSPSATRTATATGTASTTPTPTPTPSSSATPSATPTSSPTASPSSSPTALAATTTTSSPTATATSTATATQTDVAAAPPTQAPTDGPNEVVDAAPLPNPGPSAFLIKVAGPCDKVRLQVYTRAMALVYVAEAPGSSGPGWVRLSLPNGGIPGLGAGGYHYVASSIRGGARGGKVKKGTFVVLR